MRCMKQAELFYRCIFFCKTEGCFGFIIPRYHPSAGKGGKQILNCRGCGQPHEYNEGELRQSEVVGAERVRQLYPEHFSWIQRPVLLTN
jgi:hypothetical protein